MAPARPAYGAERDVVAGQVLVVDDEPAVVHLVSRMAARLNYRAVVALDAIEALDALRVQRFDLVITDYDMPLMNGCQLAQAIKALYFNTKVIMMSGRFAQERSSGQGGDAVPDGILAKPFDLNAMREALERIGLPCPKS